MKNKKTNLAGYFLILALSSVAFCAWSQPPAPAAEEPSHRHSREGGFSPFSTNWAGTDLKPDDPLRILFDATQVFDKINRRMLELTQKKNELLDAMKSGGEESNSDKPGLLDLPGRTKQRQSKSDLHANQQEIDELESQAQATADKIAQNAPAIKKRLIEVRNEMDLPNVKGADAQKNGWRKERLNDAINLIEEMQQDPKEGKKHFIDVMKKASMMQEIRAGRPLLMRFEQRIQKIEREQAFLRQRLGEQDAELQEVRRDFEKFKNVLEMRRKFFFDKDNSDKGDNKTGKPEKEHRSTPSVDSKKTTETKK